MRAGRALEITPNDIYASPPAHAAAPHAHLTEPPNTWTGRQIGTADQSAVGEGERSGTRTRGASHLPLSAPYRRIDTRSTRRSCDNTSVERTCGPKIFSTATRCSVKSPHARTTFACDVTRFAQQYTLNNRVSSSSPGKATTWRCAASPGDVDRFDVVREDEDVLALEEHPRLGVAAQTPRRVRRHSTEPQADHRGARAQVEMSRAR